MKDQALENSVVTLHQRGWSIRRLSAELGISRERVRRILSRNADHRSGTRKKEVKKRASKLDPYKGYISELLSDYQSKPPTAQRIFEIIKEKGYTGGITILQDYLQSIRGSRKKQFIQCVETTAGQRASHDWSEYQVEYTGTGKKEKIILFGYILNYSRRQYLEIVEDKTQTTLFNCLVNSFIYFKGVPLEIKSDNQKACVDRWENGNAVFNKRYLEFASWYHFKPLTITPGKPVENLKIERPFDYIKRSFFNCRTFKNKEDLEQQLRRWISETSDKRIHRRTRKSPLAMYLEEYVYLQPLPASNFDTSITVNRIVNKEACIEYMGYFYRVPVRHLGQTCLVKIKDKELIIYQNTEEIIRHRLAEPGRKNRYIGVKQRTNKATAIIEATQVKERLMEIGGEMGIFMEQMKKDNPKNYLCHLRNILSLKVNYTNHDILSAVRRAIKYKVFNSAAIETFLSVNAHMKNELRSL
jgi:transposase